MPRASSSRRRLAARGRLRATDSTANGEKASNSEVAAPLLRKQERASPDNADEDSAGETTNAMHADDVEGVIVTELELETAGQAGQKQP